jgi:putative transposase
MQQIYIENYFKRGYRNLMKYISNIAHMSEHDRKTIYHRIQVIEFFNEFGLKATKLAFKIGRSAIFDWKKRLKDSGGRLSSLKPESRKPKQFRQSKVSEKIKSFILDYRTYHPKADKLTIKPHLDIYCLKENINTVSESTIGRTISGLKKQGKLPYQYKLTIYGKTGILREKQKKISYIKKLRRKDYMPDNPGDLWQIDTITRYHDGVKRYIITAIDLVTRFTFAYTYNDHKSRSAKDFVKKLQYVSPFPILRIQTDNGSEFAKYFSLFIRKEKIIHFHNYPRCPKQNSFIERFNKTVQEQFVDYHEYLLENTDEFNELLMEYLLYYNTKKAHRPIGKIPPLMYYVNNYINNPQQSDMLWTSTKI